MADRRQLPRLWGQMEIQARAGWSRQHTSMMVNQKGFPDPVYTLGMGRIWLAEDVEAWIREHRPELAEDAETD